MNFNVLFNQYLSVLQKHNDQLYDLQFYPDSLRQILKTFASSNDGYSYTFSKLKLVIPKKFRPSHCIPRHAGDIEVILSIESDIVIKKLKVGHIEDPLIKLENFNIILNSDKYTSSWHFDRQDKKDGEGISKSLHPIYHLTFGGHYMEDLQQDDSDEFGRALIIRAPRIMHPPMELILGLDFIFNHFIPKDKLDLLSDPSYNMIINAFKKYFWMPFALAFTKNYCENINIDGVHFNFDDSFVSSVLSC